MNDSHTKTLRRLKPDARLYRQTNRPTTDEWERIRQTLGEPGTSHFKRKPARGRER